MMTPASIPLFDWDGPSFLGFYAVAFVVALIWSLRRRSQANACFGLPGAAHVALNDPYEIAFLAGGVPRCTQVALVKLMVSGAVAVRRTRILGNARLVAVAAVAPDANQAERALYHSIRSRGEKGLPLEGICQSVAPALSGVEARLAKLGLRPTSSETAGRGFRVVMPLMGLILIGVVKVVIGLSRDKPVWFLVIFLFITLMVAVMVASTRKKLTPQGEELLLRMRAERGSFRGGLEATLCTVALGGIAAAAGDPLLAGLDATVRNEISKVGLAGGSGGDASGCGTSGCGSSGCGGGCGGCGGGD